MNDVTHRTVRAAAPLLLILVVLLAVGLAGCAAPGTPLRSAVSEAVAAQPGFMGAAAGAGEPGAHPGADPGADPGTDPGADLAAWWRHFGDPTLDRLVEQAAAASPDVRVALGRVEEARAGVDVATARLLPQANVVAAGSRGTTGYDATVRQRLPDVTAQRLGVDLSWELDLFGAARAARQAARADLLASAHAQRGARLAVTAEVARQYVLLRGAQARAGLLERLVATQQDTLRLTQVRRAAGQASDFDVDRAEADLAATRAALPLLQALAAATRYRLDTLTGAPAGRHAVLLAPTAVAMVIPTVAPGVPADLLQRRPDVLAAAAQWDAARQRQSEARANRFPRAVLSALFGTQRTDWNGIDLGATRFANLAATLALPVFTGGRLAAGIAAADAREGAALAAYDRAVLQALEDVEGALALQAAERARAGDLARGVEARRAALGRARALYREGQADLLVLLDVQRGLIAAELEQVASRTDQLLAVVQLVRALGGGWETEGAPRADDVRVAPAAPSASAAPIDPRTASVPAAAADLPSVPTVAVGTSSLPAF